MLRRATVQSAPPAEEWAAAGGNLVEGDPSVSSRTPQASVQAAQSIARGHNQLSEEKRAIMAITRILGSGSPSDCWNNWRTASSVRRRKCYKKRSPLNK